MRERYKGMNRKNKRLRGKIRNLNKRVESLKLKCAATNVEVLQKAISKLPEKQQTAISACFVASQLKDSRSMRYTRNWIYECILLRVKSNKMYKQLRRDKILVLPSPKTMSTYMKNIKTSYGYQPYIFKGIEMKAGSMPTQNRRGIFAIDEIKLSEALSFNRLNLKVEGFTYLGSYTPEQQKGQ